ncbi:SOUL family heme-binding protein [Qipengyuania marisflavi]|uniref:Heme-binding protein n=1 Tax=Qipengyuania marisflavi TaxID=2486356 RepID=A0A5S3PA05_9SPHN|nr:heme-binding protein [Qipengyuania marisflavi]TMM50362.1 heme-binding protein [Qipengyuania marisflavi]
MKIWKIVAAGLGLVAVGGAAAFAQYRSGTEQPDYETLASEDAFELRAYPPLIVAEVTHTGDRRRALNAGFRTLASYIFAQDRPGAEIAMTSPVIQDEPIAMTSPVLQDGSQNGSWRTRFVMSAKYTLDTLPEAPEYITLTTMPARKVAAVRFNGTGSSNDLEEREAALRAWIASRDLKPDGPAEFAFYDAPMVPPPLRRNEVLVPVR